MVQLPSGQLVSPAQLLGVMLGQQGHGSGEEDEPEDEDSNGDEEEEEEEDDDDDDDDMINDDANED